ncbi:MAG: cupin domain-containing protein [Sporichthyaceae bacterium]
MRPRWIVSLPILAIALSGCGGDSKKPGFVREDLAKGRLSADTAFSTGPTDLIFRTVDAEPTSSSGWHSHPGIEIAVVKKGTLTYYVADARGCHQHVAKVGEAASIPAGAPHLVLNEGEEKVELFAAATVPQGGEPVKQEPTPPQCAEVS